MRNPQTQVTDMTVPSCHQPCSSPCPVHSPLAPCLMGGVPLPSWWRLPTIPLTRLVRETQWSEPGLGSNELTVGSEAVADRPPKWHRERNQVAHGLISQQKFFLLSYMCGARSSESVAFFPAIEQQGEREPEAVRPLGRHLSLCSLGESLHILWPSNSTSGTNPGEIHAYLHQDMPIHTKNAHCKYYS